MGVIRQVEMTPASREPLSWHAVRSPWSVLEFPSSLLTLIVPLGLASTAWAGDKEDVAAAAAKWADAFSAETPDRVLALYDREAVLWGTLSPKRRDNPEAIRDYMLNAFKALPDHKVSFGDQLIRVYGDMAINSGYYLKPPTYLVRADFDK